ncbi:hypothetical protein GUITHDRAFT_136191 [Guillardia theta CCMP2712]|uniref:Transcription factor TFIIIB component B'' Myb domain-containing protein n=1 Tax=Guillardia theta (strain CCMP2712) TaxID=905079 RepID=L1JKZ6_GUITC|nr:hypothetical protein GUITHDRAFT_136191 [Guillardia theta CCMP2712]EKX49002.1 hypothetical protein GUITHDRAFT_136191 [Guillardia theta CCMP2712]|eukprot:XP_005835982.1 hypothetical protein GUITHDRAFT_136191 [Guillardia theta CCMP2712]
MRCTTFSATLLLLLTSLPVTLVTKFETMSVLSGARADGARAQSGGRRDWCTVCAMRRQEQGGELGEGGGEGGEEEEEEEDMPMMNMLDEMEKQARHHRKKEEQEEIPETMDEMGLEDISISEENPEFRRLTDIMDFGSRYQNLKTKGWTVLESNRLYWGLRSFGSDFQFLQRNLFPNRTVQELKRKYHSDARRRPWLIDHAMENRVDFTPQDFARFPDQPNMEEGEEGQGARQELAGWERMGQLLGFNVEDGMLTLTGDLNDPNHPLNAAPPIPWDYAKEKMIGEKHRILAGYGKEKLESRNYWKNLSSSQAQGEVQHPRGMALVTSLPPGFSGS